MDTRRDGRFTLERIHSTKEQIYFNEKAEIHKAKEQMFKSFKCVNFPGKHPDAGADQGFLERGFHMYTCKVWGLTATKLFHFHRICNSGEPLNPHWICHCILLPITYYTEHYWPFRKFAHLNDLCIRSFDCMVIRSFHTPSRYDFRSNVSRPQKNKSLTMSATAINKQHKM